MLLTLWGNKSRVAGRSRRRNLSRTGGQRMECLEKRTLLTTFVAGPTLTGDGYSGGVGSEIGDFDQDGDLDVFSTGRFATVFENQGGAQGGTEGTFAVGQSFSQPTAIFDLESGDFDGDGDIDLVGTGQPGIELFINQGGDQGGTLGQFVNTSLFGISIQGGAVSVGDLDRDGDLDLFITGRDASKLTASTGFAHGFVAYMNQGGAQGGTEGDFAPGFLASSFDLGIATGVAGWNGYGSELGDVDGDGDLDVVAGRSNSTGHGTFILINQGAAQGGTEADFAYSGIVAGFNPWAGAPDPTVTDFDGDGDLDFISVDLSHLRRHRIQVNQGGAQGGTEGTFAPGQSLDAGGNHIPRSFDMDGDGDQDIFSGRVYINQGGLQGGTEGAMSLAASFIPETRADNSYGDLDGDGDVDFFTGRPRQILWNVSPQAPSNTAPEVAADAALVTVDEGDTAAMTGTFSDAEGNSTVTLSASSGTVTWDNATGTWSWSQGTDDGPGDGTSVTITATDDEGDTAEAHFTLAVSNVAPDASISGPASGLLGGSIDFTLGADDVSTADQATGFDYDIDWDGDGNVDQTVSGADGLSVSHTFVTGGSTTVTVTATDKDGGTSSQVSHTIQLIQPVDADIKPGNAKNKVNAKSQGRVAVAIYTTADFDAASIVGSTVQLAGVNADHFALEDVDGDGDLDLILHFDTQDVIDALGITLNSGESVTVDAELTGETVDEVMIQGLDTIEFFQPGKGKGRR